VSLPSGYAPELAFGILARDEELLALGGYLNVDLLALTFLAA
jgi:hypothetical protein